MRYGYHLVRKATWLWIAAGFVPGWVMADVVRDGTIGPDRTIQPAGPDFEISESLGELRGGNLFHSFEQFSFTQDQSATFTGVSPIENVISRVTGGEASRIDGVLRSTVPGAAVYLMNPHGIVFGPNAALDLHGAFHAGTASTLQFENGEVFSAAADTAPILSVARPDQFGFLGDAAGIELQGSFLINRNGVDLSGGAIDLNNGATVISKTEDAVDGGEIVITGGNQITLSGANDTGQGSSVQSLATAEGKGGSIHVEAPVIELRDGAGIGSTAQGTGAGGTVTVTASERLTLSGHDISGWGATLQAGSTGAADAGSLHITAPTIELQNGSYFTTSTEGSGTGGDLSVVVSNGLTLSGVNDEGWGAALQAVTSGEGRAGDIRVEAGYVELRDGALMTVHSKGSGAGGTLGVTAQERVVLSGLDGNGRAAALQAGAYGDGAGGSIHVSAPVIELQNGAFMESVTEGPGNGGEVRLEASDYISLSGRDAEGWPASLEADTGAAGNGGTLSVIAPVIDLFDGAFMSTATGGTGAGGAISLTARDRVTLSGTSFHGDGASLQATAEHDGPAGEIRIDAGLVELRDGATLLANTSGAGQGGKISITASDRITTTGVDGLGGGATLQAMATGSGAGGGVSLSAPVISLTDSTTVTSSSENTGEAGDISIIASDSLHVTDKATISSQARTASGGNISIQAGRLVYLNDSKITTDVASGTGSGGNILIDPDAVVLNGSEITAKADAGQGGEIRIIADHVLASADSVIDASAGPAGINGRVVISAPETNLAGELSRPQTAFLDAAALLRPSCAARATGEQSGRFVVAQQRGLPLSPEELLLAFDPSDVASPANVQASVESQSGDLLVSSAQWRQAADAAVSRGDGKAASKALQALARRQQTQGEYAASVMSLQDDLTQAQRDNDPARIAAALGGLGNAYLALERYDAAAALFDESLALVQKVEDPALAAVLFNNLGNLHMVQQAYEAALNAYSESARRAQQANKVELEANALANGVRSALAGGLHEAAESLLGQARAAVYKTAANQDKAANLIHLATSAQRLARVTPARAKTWRAHAYRDLREAVIVSKARGEPRLLSYALGHLGALYQQETRLDEALYLTRVAQQIAEQAGAPESLYRWYAQEGQILWAQHERDAALAAYRRAVGILESTRQETLAQYGEASLRFRQLVAPVYLALVDSLLQRSAQIADPAPLLLEARLTAEQLKAAELRDYFSDDCVAEFEAKATRLEAVSPRAAVIYPVVLPERLELLVSLPGGPQRYVVEVDSTLLTQTIQDFRQRVEMQEPWRYLSAAQQLYDWLVRPYREALRTADIDTLVFVPDGPLRTVPMAALHDGEAFLIRDYSVAVTPGLALIDPQPLPRRGTPVLLAGLSEAVRDFPALPHVPHELQTVQAVYGGQMLLNSNFTEAHLQQALEQPVSILHVASHAQFTGAAEGSFLLTYDGPLSFDRFARTLAVTRYRDQPLELLVLSACQTAAGDERAALGLAGIGVKAGARSALGSLWSISDDATAELMSVFYRRLQEPNSTKAQALRAAQQALLESRRFSHPYYWSALLLINNWI